MHCQILTKNLLCVPCLVNILSHLEIQVGVYGKHLNAFLAAIFTRETSFNEIVSAFLVGDSCFDGA